MTEASSNDLWGVIQSELRDKGIDVEALSCCAPDTSCLKVVCLPTGLGQSLEELGQEVRDQVVMVRVDEDTRRKLDAWVGSGAVKSRSEAAALFIQEGLKVRASELDKLGEAIQGVEEAKERLRKKARDVFGEQDSDAEGSD
jgi:Arc/MetJ-type ribon-helix-helix transcriptional regulator